MEYQDKYIECADCGQEFVHSADDQARYETRGLKNIPKRCPTCREAKRAKGKDRGRRGGGPGERRNDRPRTADRPPTQETSYPQYTPEPKPETPLSPAPGTAPKKPFERTETNWPDPEKYMHTVPCAECGKETSVPYKPADDLPAYCQDCFLAKLPSG